MDNQDQFDALMSEVMVIKERTNHITEYMKDNRKEIRNLTDTIKGNSKDGVLTRMDRIERWIESREWFERLLLGLLAAQVVGVVTLIAKLLLGM